MTQSPPPDRLRTCRRCGADVSHGSPYCPECGLVQTDPAVAVRTRRRRPRPAWLIPALIGGGIASMLGGALLAVALNGSGDPVATQPSPSSTASASSFPSASSEPSASASPTPSPSPTAAPIVNRAIAQILTDTAVLRANPNATAAVLAELRAGQRLFIIGEPEEADDVRWYRVGTLDDTGCDDTCGQIGWVSTPVTEDDPAIEEIDVACRPSPLSAEELAAVPPLEALHCYGRSELAITGVVAYREGGDEGPISFSPVLAGGSTTVDVARGWHRLPSPARRITRTPRGGRSAAGSRPLRGPRGDRLSGFGIARRGRRRDSSPAGARRARLPCHVRVDRLRGSRRRLIPVKPK